MRDERMVIKNVLQLPQTNNKKKKERNILEIKFLPNR